MGNWIYGFSTICLFVLFNPFIELSFGADYLFDPAVVFIIVFNFYLTGMRQAVLTFRDAFGIYWQDRYKPLFESVINLVVSISFAYLWGIFGVFMGTAISTLTTCFWVEPYILYKYAFQSSVKTYFVRYGLYTLATAVLRRADPLDLRPAVSTDHPAEFFGDDGRLRVGSKRVVFARVWTDR